MVKPNDAIALIIILHILVIAIIAYLLARLVRNARSSPSSKTTSYYDTSSLISSPIPSPFQGFGINPGGAPRGGRVNVVDVDGRGRGRPGVPGRPGGNANIVDMGEPGGNVNVVDGGSGNGRGRGGNVNIQSGPEGRDNVVNVENENGNHGRGGNVNIQPDPQGRVNI
ncbi:uncharacterized protein BCR38DRAFT_430464, partial [Pseudomassariella vexata]